MTQVTPPGWYADPGQTSDGPPTERWWDGKAWTERTRPAAPAAAWGPPGQPAEGADPAPAPGAPDASDAPDAAPEGATATAAVPLGKAPADPPADSPAPPAPAAPPAGPLDPATHPVPPPAYPAYPGQQAYPGPGYPPPGQPGQPGQYGQLSQPEYLGGHPAYPGYPGQPVPPRRKGLRIGIAIGVAAAVLASIGVGVYALTSNDSGSDRAGDSAPSPSGPNRDGAPFGEGEGGPGGGEGGQSAPPQQSAPPEVEGGGTLSDPINAISFEVPEGWTGQAMSVGAQITSDDTYDCPGDPAKSCTKGGAYSAPAIAHGTEGTTPEEIAKADIEANAEESYGGTTYGAITSHDVLLSEAVTVAGQKGYQVRWKAVTSKGADGIVESLVFPSPANPEQMVIIRIGVDAGETEAVLDEIAEGIKESSGGGGTAGQGV
ncbi:DUF2510 domain-containing protein [Streptomyces sp. NPDC004610]|uniref:DUF2510 domain-containing protein n=1 Tax=unclassified Streptomyces TaxID=2593676 RepID=UPI0033A609B7